MEGLPANTVVGYPINGDLAMDNTRRDSVSWCPIIEKASLEAMVFSYGVSCNRNRYHMAASSSVRLANREASFYRFARYPLNAEKVHHFQDEDNMEKEMESILLEILRVGLITLRNIVESQNPTRIQEQMAREWANLCHSIPPILMGR
jgi:hypothetical protein